MTPTQTIRCNFLILLGKDSGSGTFQGLGRHGGGATTDGWQLEGAAGLPEAAALHDPQVRLRFVQVLPEAGEQTVVLEQRVVTAHVCVKFVIGLLEDLPSPGGAVFQLLPREGETERPKGPQKQLPPARSIFHPPLQAWRRARKEV